MTYATGWQHDVFVSYARVDDEPLPGAADGWVCLLTEALRALLAQQLGRAEEAKEQFAIAEKLSTRGDE